jgi:hypothetical protein
MPAPTAVRTQAGALLDILWDAVVAGTAFDEVWTHRVALVAVTGPDVIVQVDVSGSRLQPYIVLTIKRMPA